MMNLGGSRLVSSVCTLIIAALSASGSGAQAPAVSPTSSPVVPIHGTVLADTIFSRALGVSKTFLVYLPPSYNTAPARRYPVAYFLHGTGGDERSWVNGLAIDSVLDSLAAHGTPEMIVVMPDGDNGFYHTWKKSPDYQMCLRQRAVLTGGELPTDYCVHHMRYDDYIARDMVARVDSVYRTVADGRHRAVAGLSMGGYGAVYLPLKYPDVFAAGASLSGAGLALMRVGGYPASTPVREATTIEELHAAWASTWGDMTDEIGSDIAEWRAVDPVWMVRHAVAEHRSLPALWFVVGTEDESTLTVNRVLHETLTGLGVPHSYTEAAGGHTLPFWRAHEGESIVWLASVIAH
jgi:enterochelin esterase-like enzyme